ncbi:DgyrCDS19 [Dimorphilus gyrociliatus]|uniref:DgyrCDS19 n=1 Tax=Dimorphilus gyrociliatus TaxID=2664684 RepID=A0A7I8V4Q1_9ANNE|nr:DgyrCDS19 [Dimorphilus gyrociliatus]
MGFQFIRNQSSSNDNKQSALIEKEEAMIVNNSKYFSISAYKKLSNFECQVSRQDIYYSRAKIIDSGSFGIVYKAELLIDSENNPNLRKTQIVAIKKVLHNKKYKNRELKILNILHHKHIVELLYYFYSVGENSKEVYLNLVMEYLPYTCYKVIRHYYKMKKYMPMIWVKIFSYQILRGLAYMHRQNFCHRDIKPQNLLIDDGNSVLKIGDFGSAKALTEGEKNITYICSRYYRAPELILATNNYNTKIDIWSTGCVICEMILGYPIFAGGNSVDQLVEIIKVRGTPKKNEIKSMNINYEEFQLPEIKRQSLLKVFNANQLLVNDSQITQLIDSLLTYNPNHRLTAMEAMGHEVFKSLLTEENNSKKLIMSKQDKQGSEIFPKMFDFDELELKDLKEQKDKLLLSLQPDNDDIDSKIKNLNNLESMIEIERKLA